MIPGFSHFWMLFRMSLSNWVHQRKVSSENLSVGSLLDAHSRMIFDDLHWFEKELVFEHREVHLGALICSERPARKDSDPKATLSKTRNGIATIIRVYD